MKRSCIVWVVAVLAGGCAAATTEPGELEFSRLYVARAARRSTSAAARAEERKEPTYDTEPHEVHLPSHRSAEEEIRGLLDPLPGRMEELRAVAADEDRLRAFLAEPVSEDDLALLAWLRSPAVSAARDHLEAARTSYRQSTDLEDLVALYRSFLRDTDVRFGPERSRRPAEAVTTSPGIARLSLDVAGRTVEMAFQDLRAAVRDTTAGSRRLHADAARLRETRRIVAEEVALDDQLVRVLRARFESGKGSQAAVLAFEARLERLRTELVILGEQEAALRSAWNALLDRGEDAPVNLDVEPAPVGPRPVPSGTASLVERALATRPEFISAELAAERAALGVRLAETMTLPRMDVGSSRFERERAGEAGVQRGAVFPAPGRMVMPRYDFGVREAQVGEMRSRAAAMERMREGMRNRVRVEVHRAIFALDSAWRRTETLAGEVIPRAERGLASTRSGYEADRETYLDLLDSVRRLLDARLGLADTRRDLAHARALLLEAVGAEAVER